jgi:PAS domain S-box-containing protein
MVKRLLSRSSLPLEERFIAATLLLVGAILLTLFALVLSVLRRYFVNDPDTFFLSVVVLMTAVSIAYISLIVIQWFLLRRMVIKPVKEFLAASKEIADGNLARRVNVHSEDEMGILARSFNAMTEKLAGLIMSLSELKQFNEEILESMSSGVIVVRNDSRVATVNKAAERILGLRPEEAVGKPVEGLDVDERMRTLVIFALRYRKMVDRMEVEVERNDGGKAHLGIAVSHLLSAAGWFEGIIVLFTDLTETKRLQRDVELSRQMAALGELTAGVVHELRNPLAAISGMAELLLREMDGRDTSREKVAHILQEVSLLDGTVGQFLAFARPFDLNLKEVDLRNVIERALTLCSARLDDKQINVVTSFDEEVKSIRGDSEKLAQAVVNLINNAADAISNGGNVAIALRPGYDGAREDETLLLIGDDGPGVRPEDRDKVFKPFFTQKRDGTGLGLAIVHRIVTAHGGTIKLEDGDQPGATFRIALPTSAPTG